MGCLLCLGGRAGGGYWLLIDKSASEWDIVADGGSGGDGGKGHGEKGEAEVEMREGVRSEMLQVWPPGGVIEIWVWKESLHARRGRKRRQQSACVRFAS